ncbi:MAG TPA: cytochrome ubiquinol oxidase subunit I [Noviherbaspirillum sp.]|nr:cytochrome ubiquinol oxidase subunit I [Noviherbaspirillum sp.]
METIAGFDATLLARIQSAFTVSFHIIFPAFSIGLSAFIATLEVLWLRSGEVHYHTLARFWTKIFRGIVCNECGVGHRAVVPVRYQLEPLLRNRRQHHRPGARP